MKESSANELNNISASVRAGESLRDLAVDIVDLVCRELDIRRCSLWRLSKDGKTLVCELLLETGNGVFREPMELSEADLPNYFAALQKGGVVSASDARNLPETSEFNDTYFIPNNIYSLIDVPIIVKGEIKGIICGEQLNAIKWWNEADESFLEDLAKVIRPLFQ